MHRRKANRSRSGQSGYVLLALMLAVTLILIALSVEAPRIAQQIKREKEEELVHRGKDYATAIKRFVHKNGGRFPLSVEQLEDTNHVRYLRKRYKDPMTGEDNWRMVHFGEAMVNIPTPNPGLSGSTNPAAGNTLGGTGGATGPAQNPAGPAQNPNLGGAQLGQAQPQPNNTAQLGSLTTSNIGNGQTVGGGQIIGVASVDKGQGI
jgi:type II secretory pathway pseudopilin PulG